MPGKKKASEVLTDISQQLGVPPENLPAYLSRLYPTSPYFKIGDLEQKEITDANIFSDDDFINNRNPADVRDLTIVKLGSLLVEFSPGGKGSYSLNIKLIDKEARQIRPMFRYDGERYPCFGFTDLVPLLENYGVTMNPIRLDEPTAAESRAKAAANKIRDILTNMALGELVDPPVREAAAADFFAAIEAFNQQQEQEQQERDSEDYWLPPYPPPSQASNPAPARNPVRFFPDPVLEERDVPDFSGENFKNKPRSPQELAAKLAVSFLLELSLNKEQVKLIINEYLDETGALLTSMDEAWIQSLMITPIDKGRYTLKTVFPEENTGETLLEVIREIEQQEKEPEASASAKK